MSKQRQPEGTGVTVYFPFADLPHGEIVVTPLWVHALMNFHAAGSTTPCPPAYQQDNFVILETSWATAEMAEAYKAGHLPGAIHLNTDDLETGFPRWRLQSIAQLQRTIGAHGIGPRTTVVVYSHQMIAAARVWWALRYSGVADVRLLNGGMAAWLDSGYLKETQFREPRPVYFTAKPHRLMRASTQQVRASQGNGQSVPADVRSRQEFEGRISGYDYLELCGRIPGAIIVGDADDSSHLYTHANGTLKDPSTVEAMWLESGLKRGDGEIIFYCGSGWRSSLAYLHAQLLGWPGIRNYSDGWIGWSTTYVADERVKGGSTPGWRQRSTGNPVVTGEDNNDGGDRLPP